MPKCKTVFLSDTRSEQACCALMMDIKHDVRRSKSGQDRTCLHRSMETNKTKNNHKGCDTFHVENDFELIYLVAVDF